MSKQTQSRWSHVPGPSRTRVESTAEIHSITDARVAHSDEMRTRMIKYSVSMGIRMVCLVLVFVVDGWLQWVFIAGAVFLPYFAVIVANGGSDTSNLEHSAALLDQAPAPALDAPRAEPAPPNADSEVIQGEVVPGDPPAAASGRAGEEASASTDAEAGRRHA
jgi:hypothetical protein